MKVDTIIERALENGAHCSNGCSCLAVLASRLVDHRGKSFRSKLHRAVETCRAIETREKRKAFFLKSCADLGGVLDPSPVQLVKLDGPDCLLCITAVGKLFGYTSKEHEPMLSSVSKQILKQHRNALLLNKLCELFRQGKINTPTDDSKPFRIQWTKEVCEALGSDPLRLKFSRSINGIRPSNLLLVTERYPCLDSFVSSVGGCYFHMPEHLIPVLTLFRQRAHTLKDGWDDIASVGADLETKARVKYKVLKGAPDLLTAATMMSLKDAEKRAEIQRLRTTIQHLNDLIHATLNKLQADTEEAHSSTEITSAIEKCKTKRAKTVGLVDSDTERNHLRGRLEMIISFLLSDGHYFQRCHTDFKRAYFLKHKGRVFIGFAPLTKDGCFLHVWRRGERDGRRLFLPFGGVLILPCDALHGGGMRSALGSKNLRLHFYFFLDNVSPPGIMGNEYVDFDGVEYSDKYGPSRKSTDELAKLFV